MATAEPLGSTVEPQALSPSARTAAISWTGGKDCNLALLHAWRDPSLRVTALVVFRPENAAFRAHPLWLAEAQAESLNLPLRHVIISSDAASYKEAYVAGIRKLRVEHGIETIVTGDMDLVGSMARNWIEECGEEAGVEAGLPLWQADRATCLRQLIAERFVVIFSCVKSPWFDASWIGRRLDAATLEAMEAMAAAAPEEGVKPLDLGGERGECMLLPSPDLANPHTTLASNASPSLPDARSMARADHTMCLGGPLYAQTVQPLEIGEPLELTKQPGQRDGERWWTLGLPTPSPTPQGKIGGIY